MNQTVRTAALVADGAVGQVAALGDGDGQLRLDPDSTHDLGEQHRAEARGAPHPDLLHRRAAAVRRLGVRVLPRRHARHQLQGLLVRRGGAALVLAPREPRRGEDGGQDQRGGLRSLCSTLVCARAVVTKRLLSFCLYSVHGLPTRCTIRQNYAHINNTPGNKISMWRRPFFLSR